MSIKFSVRNFHPLASVYWAKPIVHTWLARVGRHRASAAATADASQPGVDDRLRPIHAGERVEISHAELDGHYGWTRGEIATPSTDGVPDIPNFYRIPTQHKFHP